MDLCNTRLIVIAVLTGFLGDLILQLMVNKKILGADKWGLDPYFAQHGKAEASFIAGGIMGGFYSLYALTGLPFKLQYMAIYGLIIDLIYRHARVFPSLDKYYENVGYFGTVVVGAVVPLCIPLLIIKLIDRKVQII
jgi:hypothetical protein